jgi:3-oxoacyl-[acyl-carrier-protein] synthase III
MVTHAADPGRSSGPAAVLAGLGAWLPPLDVGNAEIAGRLGTDDAWIRSRTGIARRRRAAPGTSTGDLAVEAGRLALKASGEASADALVLATTTPDRPCPATAPETAARLGLTGIAAFDISAVCTGFLYGLAVAAGLIAAGTAERVLLIGAETYSTILDPEDRDTAVIFGDAAGAAVLRAGDPAEPGALGPVVLGSDGGRADLISIPAGGSRQRSSGRPPGPRDHLFQMAGRDTYRHAVERMTAAAEQAVALAGWRAADVDRFAAHQANARITAAVGQRLGVPAERRLSDIERLGNTAAASIPVLLAESVADGSLQPGHRTLLAAFGGGLTWGATTLVWPTAVAHVHDAHRFA